MAKNNGNREKKTEGKSNGTCRGIGSVRAFDQCQTKIRHEIQVFYRNCELEPNMLK
jgi:hypothetical protein